MFKHILVPTDLTERSVQALEIALKMASFHDHSRVTLLHVIEVIEDTDNEQFEEFYKKLGRRARKKMEQIVDPFRDSPLKVGREIVYGKRVGGIIDFVHENYIDLIVLSSHRISIENDPHGWGTISYKVGILSPCPVMLVK